MATPIAAGALAAKLAAKELRKRARIDVLFITLFGAAMLAGSALMLKNVNTPAGYNAQTLMILSMVGLMFSANRLKLRPDVGVSDQLQWAGLGIVPSACRYALTPVAVNSPTGMFGSLIPKLAEWATDPITLFLGIGAVLLGAVAEETWRAGFLNMFQFVGQKMEKRKGREKPGSLISLLAWLGTNAIWLGWHFWQRPWDPYYALWLSICAIIFSLCLHFAGLGSATLAHVCTNLVI